MARNRTAASFGAQCESLCPPPPTRVADVYGYDLRTVLLSELKVGAVWKKKLELPFASLDLSIYPLNVKQTMAPVMQGMTLYACCCSAST